MESTNFSDKEEHLAWVQELCEEEGEEAARTYMFHFIKKGQSVLKYMEARNDPCTKCPEAGCTSLTFAKGQRDIRRWMLGHHCMVDDRRKAGAYNWIAIDKVTGKIKYIIYPGFGKNLQQSLRFLSLVAHFAVGTSLDENGDPTASGKQHGNFSRTIDDLFKECDQIYMVQYELESRPEYPEDWLGDPKRGEHGVAHHAEGVMLEECKSRSRNDELVRYFLNSSRSWTSAKFSEGDEERMLEKKDFKHYVKVIEEKIAIGDCLSFSKDNFVELARLFQSHPMFKSIPANKEGNINVNTIFGFLAKGKHVKYFQEFNDVVGFLKNLDKSKKFQSMPICI